MPEVVPGREGLRRAYPSSPGRAARASALLRAWIEEGDALEQQETGQYLLHALDEDRPSERPLFPASLKGVTW